MKSTIRICMLSVLCLIFLSLFSGIVSSEEVDDTLVSGILSEYINIYSEEIENSAYNVGQLNEIVPDFSVNELLKQAANGGFDFDIKRIFEKIIDLLFKEVKSSFRLMLLILSISLLCSYTVNLSDTTESLSGVSKTSFYVCYMIICGISAAAFMEVISYGRIAIENMSVFMQTIIPLILMSLVSCGALVSATVFEPVLIVTIEITTVLIKNVFIPLLLMSAAIELVNNMSDNIKVDKLITLINKTIKWGLGICLTVFVGIAGIQGMASGTVSGMGVKVSKFAASNLIPIVGGILSDSVETIMNCSLIIKNSLGIVGVIILILIVLSPLIKIGASLMIFRVTAAIAEPISNPKIVKCISGLANSISVMFSMVAAIAVMFIIILTIVINAGNMAVMIGK